MNFGMENSLRNCQVCFCFFSARWLTCHFQLYFFMGNKHGKCQVCRFIIVYVDWRVILKFKKNKTIMLPLCLVLFPMSKQFIRNIINSTNSCTYRTFSWQLWYFRDLFAVFLMFVSFSDIWTVLIVHFLFISFFCTSSSS